MMTDSNNFERARFNMIEQQIRPAEVLDPNVLHVMSHTPRELFVPREYEKLAFSDTHIPLGHAQQMMKPIQEARLLQALNIQHDDEILEVGSGSGYLTALLAALGKQVTSVDIVEDFTNSAKQKLKRINADNVEVHCGDAGVAWQAGHKFDAIAITGSYPVYRGQYKPQLKINGRLFVITGTAPAMSALLITRVTEHEWVEESLFETFIPALTNVETPSQFVF